ncbi:hypothetical protein [Conexibacter sp. CPCC 206217]|uniref:hypothetical protein n=1 Tax=Conexibacter sp. CPCC 206217 TaxID=3064574 RepID=UPI002725D2BA|nr:hypothetical protein [Conexibacter sp. CPCC 206217]MDO8211746.1 hypothetical protein [Conexibacter sp. CPCC 206217]
MNSSDLHFPSYDAAAQQPAIRWALFTHGDVRDVLPTLHRDTLRVIHRGPIDDAWRTTLTAAGFPAPRVDAAILAPVERGEERHA